MTSEGRFAGKSVVITGASSGIGYELASRLACEGAAVYAVARRPNTTDVVNSFPADLTVQEELDRWIAHLRRVLTSLDILIHCAGGFSRGTVANISIGEFDYAMNINLRVPFQLTQALLPFLQSSRGQIAFLNSSAVSLPRKELAVYTMSKQALRAFADVLRDEVNEYGISVTSIFPGRTATPMQEQACAMESRKYTPDRFLQPADVANSVMNSLLMPETAEITDIYIRPKQKS